MEAGRTLSVAVVCVCVCVCARARVCWLAKQAVYFFAVNPVL